MKRVRRCAWRCRLGAWDFQVDYDGFLSAPNDHRFYRLVAARIHFLVRDIRRNIDEIARTGLINEFEAVTPSKARSATDDV
jgi:hypothetical protein